MSDQEHQEKLLSHRKAQLHTLKGMIEATKEDYKQVKTDN